MDDIKETSISQAKDSQFEDSWIPATPAKPGAAETQPIWTANQETQPSDERYLEFERFLQENKAGEANRLQLGQLSSESFEEAEEQVAFWGSTNSDGGIRGFNPKEEAAATNSQLCGDNVGMYNEFPACLEEGLINMPFSDLLKWVGKDSASISGNSSSLGSFFEPQVEGDRLESNLMYSSPIDIDLSLGSSFQSSRAPQHGISFPCKPSFDLNSPAKTTEAAITGKHISQFAPLTPSIANSVTRERAIQARNEHDRVEVNELQNENGQLQLQEDHDPDKGRAQQKPRRKRHRPKVVREGQPKRARKTSTPKPVGPGETPTGKRKYVRKKGLKTPTATPPAEQQNGGTNDPKTVEHAEQSCRTPLNFEFESQAREESSCKPPSNFGSQQNGGTNDPKRVGRAEKSCRRSLNFEFENRARDESSCKLPSNLGSQQNGGTNDPKTVGRAEQSCRRSLNFEFESQVRDESSCKPPSNFGSQQSGGTNDPKTVGRAEQSCSRSLNFEFGSQAPDESPSCKPPSNFCSESQIRAEKTQVGTPSRNQAVEANPTMLVKHAPSPSTPNKTEDFLHYKLMDDAQNSTRGKCRIVFSNETHDKEASSVPKFIDLNMHAAPRRPIDFLQAHHMLPVNEDNSGRIFGGHFARTYKRRRSEEGQSSATSRPMSTVTAAARDPVRQLRTAENRGATSVMQGSESSDRPRTCIGALFSSLGMFSLDPRLIQPMNLGISEVSNRVVEQEQSALVPYLYHMKYQQQNEVIAYNMRCQEANQLVVYQREGTVVPFEGPSGPVKRRKPRPKVDLDEETTRVWNLLIQDINSEGIDGTEEKAKWWEEERRVFRGRADSFIARMHLVQGDRRFSKWKGSVVDSVVGVFLTQNVSDHLSSSAFMSLAARFPLKSQTNNEPPREDRTSILIQEPEVSVQESDNLIGWHEEKSSSTGCDKSFVTVQYVEYSEAKEVVNSIESSQNSANSSVTQTNERTESCSQGNSEAKLMGGSKPNRFGCSNSFVELLEMAEMPMLHGVCNQERGSMLSSKKSGCIQVEGMTCEFDSQDQYKDRSDGPKASLGSTISSNYTLHLNHNSRYNSNTNEEKCASEESELSAESAIQDTFQIIKDNSRKNEGKPRETNLKDQADNYKGKSGKTRKERENPVDWDSLRKQAEANGKRERTASTMDSLDWEEIRCADVNVIADAIKERGMNNRLADRIKDFLNRLVRDHGSIDLEWLRDIPPDKAKEYLLSIRGLGLKSVECVRLLTLHHLAFPVDTNVGRIAVRLGWVPLQPLPESLQLHLLELYPVLESIQKYLWPRLCKLDQKTLYELHYQMITFGKVFCTKNRPNCNACPLRGECRHFASAFASARLSLPAPEDEKSALTAVRSTSADHIPAGIMGPLQLPPPQANLQLEPHSKIGNCAPIIEEPATPEPIIEEPATPESIQTQILESDIEDTLYEDPEDIPTIKLNLEEFTQNLQNYMEKNMELQEGDMSKALVALTPDAASIPVPKLKNVNQLRTEHQVYELPDSHPLLAGLDKREPDDPCPYLLAIWTPGETAESIQPPEGMCSSQESGKLCDEKTCFSCNNIREANSLTVRGTILIPCRTANRGSFPLNGTYFQVNEVFADHESSLNPIDVPRDWIWNLPRRTVYFGTSIPTIFKGLSTEGVQYCFWRGFVCVRGFDRKTRAPRPLMARLHFPASKLAKAKAKTTENHGHNEPSIEGTRLKFPQVHEEQQKAEIELASNKGDLVIGVLGSIPEPQG